MAKDQDTTRTRIDSIKTAVRSVSTCTATTRAELQDVLAGSSPEPSQKENIRVKKPQSRSAPPTARRKAGAATTTATDVANPPTLSLSPRERYILATEVANTTLKTLADALKTHPPTQHRSTTKTRVAADENVQKPPKPRTAHAKSTSVSSHPLKERSVSQTVNSPRKPSSLRRSSSYSSFLATGPDSGVLATAECARIAFAYLGTGEAVKIAGKDSPELQLENGILALIGKLVAHGLDSLAIKEMRTLKRRLEGYLGKESETREVRPPISRTGSQQHTPVERDNAASLLDFGDVDRKSAVLPIITNLQIYALRVIARIKRPRIVESAWNHLKLSSASSPANLIWHIAKSTENRAKSARQLESLAQTVLLLCPSISSADDGDDLQPSPDIVLYLQHLAFRIRQRWWALAKHQGDKDKELLEPFSRCLAAFSRRSKLSPAKKFKLAESLYLDLAEQGQDAKSPSPNSPRPNSIASKSLSSLAQAAGLPDEALRWLETTNPSTTACSAAKKAAQLVRITTVTLEAFLKDSSRTDITDTITTVLETLSDGLGGSATELDSLFMEVNALRRMATRALSINRSESEEMSNQDLGPQCIRIIAASVHFTTRFIGVRPSAEADTASMNQHRDRLAMASKLAKSTVDSVLVCCKRPLTNESSWNELDLLIQDCVNLLCRFEEHSQNDPSAGSILQDGPQSPHVRFSNAYWAIHLQLQKLDLNMNVAITAMQRSTELLRTRSQPEKEAGVLPMKLERLGEALDRLDRADDSRDALAQCIQHLLAGGVDQDLIDMTAKYPVRRIFRSASSVETLGRVLKSYHRSFIKYGLKRSDEVAFFDDSAHPTAVRGVMLEWQLSLYQTSLSKNRQWDSNLNSSVQAVAEQLLDLYTTSRFPIRRQRLYLELLQLSHSRPDVISSTLLPEGLRSNGKEKLGVTDDRNLERFVGHLSTLLMLKSSLQEAIPSVTVIRECFSFWESLVNSVTSWDELVDRVDNVEHWVLEIHASIDYLIAKGEEYESLPALHLLVKVLELQKDPDSSELVTTLAELGLQFLRLGYSGKAGLTFSRAEVLILNQTTSTEAKLRWHIGYAEYLLKIGNTTKCETVLLSSHAIAQDDNQFMSLAKPSTTLSGRNRFNRILADVCYVSSLLSTQLGNYKDAAKYARQSVVLNRRIWAALETKSNNAKAASTSTIEPEAMASSKAAFDPLSSMRNEKGVPLVMSVTHDALNGADFWSLVPSLHRALMQHSLVFSYQGALHEAVYVADQAEKVATAICSSSLTLENASRRAEYWTESGKQEKAQAILDSIDLSHCGKHITKLTYYSSVAKGYHLSKRFNEEFATYDSMESLLNELTSPAFIKSIDIYHPSVDALATGISAMTLENTGPSGTRTTKSARGRPPVSKVIPNPVAKTSTRTTRKATLKSAPTVVPKTKQKPVPQATEQTSISEQCATLGSLQTDVILRRAMMSLLQDDVSKAMDILQTIESLKGNLDRNMSFIWTRFKAMLSHSIRNLAEDFTFNTLPESTIAFPVMPMKERQSSEGVARRPVVTAVSKPGRGKKQPKEDFADILRSARAQLVDAHAMCAAKGSNHVFQQLSAALGHVTVLLSAVSGGQSRGSLHPLYAAYMSEIPRCNSLKLAQESVEVEHEPMSREDCLQWPMPSQQRLPLTSIHDFQKDYIDIIPETWTAVSLELNEEHTELYITRYESGAAPFILRLPLTRQSSRDMDEEAFTFTDGKHEFEEIIELSDFSTRSAKDMTSKEARLQWWAEREGLDTKLHELLINIENIWLGGFKGIFSQHIRQPDLLARFRKAFDNTLNRHLPSRRKKGQQKKTSLDSRVLELFVGLGDATNEDIDLDEALSDLMYFVVDILQFNGERNAYDEIDFDAMVIEILDALRAYHNASQNTSSINAHTILILDKNLHMLPWESLPCLEKLSISRLPSLAALRERILAAKQPTVTHNAQPGHYISAEAGGTSILNPSGDLSHTLKTIKPHLDGMQGNWTHIANRAPTEKEFEDSLREKDLVLYFGHGSGAQFVRSKAVRRLYLGAQEGDARKAGCATTFLFGCSSVHISENGIYEPSGMLASYLTAGAPAVVGMLWDVTDKDCDRLAVKAGELWGLWPEYKEAGVEAPPTVKKSKGKGKVAQLVEEVESSRGTGNGRRGRKDRAGDDMAQSNSGATERRRGTGLDEAICQARQACVLRYLNGAAAVVYGIPVYLD